MLHLGSRPVYDRAREAIWKGRLGTVVRFVGSQIVVSCRSDRDVRYVHHFDWRGVRVGGGGCAELVTPDASEPALIEQRRQVACVDAAYRE